MTQPLQVQVVHPYAAAAERVFDAWLDHRQASTWLFATDDGRMVRTDIAAQVGGRFTITESRAGGDVTHTGRYLEISRPRRLSFTFAVPQFSDNEDIVVVDIEASDVGCELTLTHDMDPRWAEFASRTRDGWRRMLDNLDEQLGAA